VAQQPKNDCEIAGFPGAVIVFLIIFGIVSIGVSINDYGA
jgi:hypothetical protein